MLRTAMITFAVAVLAVLLWYSIGELDKKGWDDDDQNRTDQGH